MTISRREAIRISGSTLAGLSLGMLKCENLEAQAAAAQQQPPVQPVVQGVVVLLRQGGDGGQQPLPLGDGVGVADRLTGELADGPGVGGVLRPGGGQSLPSCG